MTPYEIIYKKRNGGELTPGEIKWFISGYTAGDIPDYQAAALLMAIFLKGMTAPETTELAMAMMNSGRVFDLSDIPGIKVDKHSTGGVGDKVSIILAPIVAAAGVPVPMVSGRGLGHTGGTLDKLESIPGFRTNLSYEEFRHTLARIGLAMMGQTPDLAPADKKLYALRDVTATVDCIPLIAASIMSKKLAEGADGLVLDVKTGSGAFMQKQEDALALTKTMTAIGQGMGKKMKSLITDMNQPLGRTVGNALEIEECVDCLKGSGPGDLMEVTYALGAEMLVMGERATDVESGRRILQQVVTSGQGLEKFREMVSAHGGNVKVADDYKNILPQAKHGVEAKADKSGYIYSMDNREVGLAGVFLGCGRLKMEDIIDPAVGFIFERKIGDAVKPGDTIVKVLCNDEQKGREAARRLVNCINISEAKPEAVKLIKEII
ncbi:MAG: thymidine phosphorylase [Candidatus Edwardsbacteria bacterium]|nr:thymidine phosphorylase [Candidatus Edwardsbacteria bacterium]MBU1576359.1 thymidine phosphorylase [Candidatus Edwardsbacteria bacterium]MBU2462771.1 thymidine phosphorylase [Candidatus Edwardsbacteria bacterium]MBU2593536.1 thymidine phosphorylase [Candidatus Edwardsbacteria bacterium]